MDSHMDTGTGGTLLHPKPENGPTSPGRSTPDAHRLPFLWPLVIVLVVVLASLVMVLAARTDTQPITPSEATSQVHHDSGISKLLQEREQRGQMSYDSGIERSLRERAQSVETHYDSGIARLLRERE